MEMICVLICSGQQQLNNCYYIETDIKKLD